MPRRAARHSAAPRSVRCCCSCAERALEKFLPSDAHVRCGSRLRVLLTKARTAAAAYWLRAWMSVSVGSRRRRVSACAPTQVTMGWPFFMGEVPQEVGRHSRCVLAAPLDRHSDRHSVAPCVQFRSARELWHVLRASCHVPLIGGILPYSANGGRPHPPASLRCAWLVCVGRGPVRVRPFSTGSYRSKCGPLGRPQGSTGMDSSGHQH